MIRTEKIILNDKRLKVMLQESTSIYNQSLYFLRQSYFKTKKEQKIKTPNYYELYNLVKNEKCFKESNLDYVAKQSIIKQASTNWTSFIKSTLAYKKNKDKFKAKPKIPRYFKNGKLNLLTYDIRRISKKIKCHDKSYEIKFLKSDVSVKIPKYIDKASINCFRILSYYDKFKIEVIYEKAQNNLSLNKQNVIGIDIGLNNLCAITTNNQNKSWIIKGGVLKSINQFYNKEIAKIKSELKLKNNRYTSRKLEGFNKRREQKINVIFHNISRKIVNLCINENIGKIVIGHNNNWKQNCKMRKNISQNFVQIPFNKLILMLSYKANENNIDVIIINESYTSKCDHLAFEEMKHQESYLGKRIKRGLFKSSIGKNLNADINGAIGILIKAKEISDVQIMNLRNRGDVVSPMQIKIA